MPTISEKKILNAIKYFIKNTDNIGLTKLFKLLFFFDFMYFKEHGLKVTMLDYYTYDFGPVPVDLYKTITSNNLPDYLKDEILFSKEKGDDEFANPKYKIKLKKPDYDLNCFTPYERKMLEKVAFIFKEADANTISEISHLKNQPWDKTRKTKGMFQYIDFELAIDDEATLDIDEIHEYMAIQKELKSDGRI